ncbi:MAG: phage tail sheath family protein [Bradymonadia bacterium]
MKEYLSPGVYVEEVPSASKPIEAVGTSTVGFIGVSSRGPVNVPVLCPNWSTFTKNFGDFKDGGHFAHAVYGFFNNGGSRCFVLNVGDDEANKDKNHASLAARFLGEDKGPGARSGLFCFEEIEEISIVVAPGQTDPAIQDAVLSHCEKMRYRMAILDCPEVIEEGGVDKLPKPRDSKYGAYYFPWIQVYDPQEGEIFVPPSGHMAGIYARSDGERGVHKAPANEVVRGALDLKYQVTKGEQDILNPKGINCIRYFDGRGIRVWGARTISSDPEWRYVNVRRLFNMVEKSIEDGTQWVVFEPNDQTLWKRVTRNITAFLLRVWREGGLFGETPEQAFYVKCDAETNPPEVIDAGQLIVEIGMCPTKPAEFVIFRIGQMPTGGDSIEG